MEHKSNFDGSLYRKDSKKKPKKVKMKCNGCGFISSETAICPNNDGTMHPYKNQF